mgnify:CR=1 FL=1
MTKIPENLISFALNTPKVSSAVVCANQKSVLESVKELNSNKIKGLICITSDKCYADNFSTKGFKETDRLGGEDPYSGSKASAEIIINTYKKMILRLRQQSTGSNY